MLFEGVTLISNQILHALYIGCGVLFFMLFFLITFLKGKIPEIISVMKAEMFKRPWVHVHTSLNQLELYAPKRSGDKQDENTYDMEKYLGVKITPNPEKVESSVNGRRIIHYYSKSAPSLTAKEAAACRDVLKHLSEQGMQPTESLIDALFVATDEELKEWYGEDSNVYREVNRLKTELQNKFIQDGQFVWATVKDFIFAASNETSRSLDEFKSIAHEQADERIRALMPGGDIKVTLTYALVLVFGLAVGYKIMVA